MKNPCALVLSLPRSQQRRFQIDNPDARGGLEQAYHRRCVETADAVARLAPRPDELPRRINALHSGTAFRGTHAHRLVPHPFGKALARGKVTGIDRQKEMRAAVGLTGISVERAYLGADRAIRQAAAQEI